jgi:hypothetical protein
MIRGEIHGVEQTQADLAARANKTLLALRDKVWELSLRLQSKVQGNLSAGIGLKSRHGSAGLSGSVRALDPEVSGTAVIGGAQAGGGPFWYGRMWEFTGHKEIVPISPDILFGEAGWKKGTSAKRALHFFANGKEVFTRRVSAQQPRPWMIPPFQEFKPTIAAELRETAKKQNG